MALPFLCWAALLHLVAGIRVVPPKGDPPPDVLAVAKDRGAAEAMGLPNITEFKRVWQMRYRSERHLHEPMSSRVKMVLGIFSVPWQTEYRKVLRRTWLKQSGVCLYDGQRPDPACSVQVAFVHGNHSQGDRVPRHRVNDSWVYDVDVSAAGEAAARKEPGYFELDVEEHMNEGKTFAWFATAAKEFPWATHIAKGDMDMYPFLHKLVKRMSDRVCRGETPYEFAGRAYRCPSSVPACHGDIPDSTFSASCAPHPCDKNYTSKEEARGRYSSRGGEPFAYMGGPLYIMSRQLVERLTVPGGWWEAHRGPGMFVGEDMVTSLAMDHVAAKEGFCVSTWSPDAYHHGTDRTSNEYLGILEDYANNF